MANKKIIELTLASPSSSASVVGEDGGVAKRFPVSSFGGGGGIIDVDTLPTENIDTNAIYRILEEEISSLDCYFEGTKADNFTVLIVDGLPETGVPAFDVDEFKSSGIIVQTVYYNTQDGKVHAYVNDAASDFLAESVPVSIGWHTAEEMWEEMYGGVFNSADEIPDDAQFMCCVVINKSKKSKLYSYYNNGTEIVQTRIITSENFKFYATTGTLVLDL